MAMKMCPLLSCALYILLYSLVFGIGYHALVLSFAMKINLGFWFYLLFLLDIWVIFNILFNYTMCVLTKPGSPENIPSVFLNQINHKCNKCGVTKPPRTHHCSICNECVLQMDRIFLFIQITVLGLELVLGIITEDILWTFWLTLLLDLAFSAFFQDIENVVFHIFSWYIYISFSNHFICGIARIHSLPLVHNSERWDFSWSLFRWCKIHS